MKQSKQENRYDLKDNKKLDNIVRDRIVEFLRGNTYMFAWSPEDFLGLDPCTILPTNKTQIQIQKLINTKEESYPGKERYNTNKCWYLKRNMHRQRI